MTSHFERGYFPSVLNRWQHTNAFVIQFRPATNLAAGQCVGRAEHVATSRATHFGSLAELLAFIECTLSEVRAQSQAQEMSKTVSITSCCKEELL